MKRRCDQHRYQLSTVLRITKYYARSNLTFHPFFHFLSESFDGIGDSGPASDADNHVSADVLVDGSESGQPLPCLHVIYNAVAVIGRIHA